MNSLRFRTTSFLVLLIVSLGICFALVLPFLRLIAWAIILAVVAHPIHRCVLRHLKQPSLAAAVSCLLIAVAVIVPVTFITLEVLDEAFRLTKYLQSAIDKGELAPWLHPDNIPLVNVVSDWIGQRIDLSQFNVETWLRQTASQTSVYLAKRSVGLVKNAAWDFVQVALTLVTLFFMLRDSSRLLPVVRTFIPLNEAQTDALLDRGVDAIHAAVYGATVVALAQGSLGGLAFWILGLQSPLLWGTVMTTLSFIPLLGSPVVWVPTVILLLIQGIYWKAIALVLWGVLVIGLIDNILRPIVIGSKTQMHALVVFFSVLGGLLLMGPLGLLLGPVILAVTFALLDILGLKLAEGDDKAKGLSPETVNNETVLPITVSRRGEENDKR